MSEKRIGLVDIVLYATSMNFSVRWLASGAAVGPVALPVWVLAALLFLAPLVTATMALSERFPNEGAVYSWTRETFGSFAGFICGWVYWACNLPFFAGLVFFVVNLIARAIGGEIGALLLKPAYLFVGSSAIIILTGALHSKGLGVGKWIPIVGAIASLGLLAFLIWAGFNLAGRDGSATDFATASYLPKLDANGAILWSTMVFAYGGAEGVALLRNQARGGAKQIGQALVLIGVLLSLAYVMGTASLLMIIPQDQASRLGGLAEALEIALQRLDASPMRPWVLGVLSLAMLGSLSAWFGAAAQLPYAAGLDKSLPSAISTLDAKTGAPITAIWGQTILVIIILGLSCLGGTLTSAYDFIIAMSVLSYAIPFLFLFAAYWKIQTHSRDNRYAKPIAIVGFLVTLSAIICSFVPSSTAINGLNDIIKLGFASFVLLASGSIIYVLGRAPKKDTKPKKP